RRSPVECHLLAALRFRIDAAIDRTEGGDAHGHRKVEFQAPVDVVHLHVADAGGQCRTDRRASDEAPRDGRGNGVVAPAGDCRPGTEPVLELAALAVIPGQALDLDASAGGATYINS